MLQSEMKVDGNAIGGLLREIFTMEMTTPRPRVATAARSTRWAGWLSISMRPERWSDARTAIQSSCASCTGAAATGST